LGSEGILRPGEILESAERVPGMKPN